MTSSPCTQTTATTGDPTPALANRRGLFTLSNQAPTQALSVYIQGEVLMPQWHYQKNGARHVAMTDEEISALIEQRTIDGNTLVWTPTLGAWTPLAQTDLARFLQTITTPPPLPGSSVSNTVVWLLAVAPFVGLMLEGMIGSMTAGNPAYAEQAAIAAIASGEFFYVTLALNIGLSLFDELRLKRAGTDTSGFGKMAFIVPVYLWKRAKSLGQKPTYFYVWIAVFAIALLTAMSAGEGSPDLSTHSESSSTEPYEATPVVPSKPSVAIVPISDDRFVAAGGSLQVVESNGQRLLTFGGEPVQAVTDDLVQLHTAYRYGDRDIVLVTHACGGSGCRFTKFVLVDIPAHGSAKLIQDERLTIDVDSAAPDIYVQSDGSLLIAFYAQGGTQRFRYANGMLNPV